METKSNTWIELDEIDAKYKATAGTVLNIHEFNKVAITSHSTRIEGSTLTMDEVFNLIEKGTPATGKPIHHQNMVIDHYEALEFVLNKAAAKSSFDITLLKAIASKTMKRTGKVVNSILGNTDESHGDLRKVNVSAGGHYFVDQLKVPSMMDRLVSNIATNISLVKSPQEIYTLAFEAHFDMVSIHPFTDGNGRTSRLAMNYIEAYHGKPLTVVFAEDAAEYYGKLNESRNLKSTKPIVEFLASQHIKFLSNHIQAYEKGIRQELKPERAQTLKEDNPIGYSLFF